MAVISKEATSGKMSGRATRGSGARHSHDIFKALPDIPSDVSPVRSDDKCQHTTPDSDQLPRHTTPDEVLRPDQLIPPPFVLPMVWRKAVAPAVEAKPLALHKWNSPGDYIRASNGGKATDVVETPLSEGSFRRATITVSPEFPMCTFAIPSRSCLRPAPSQPEAAFSSVVDFESEGSGNHQLRSSAPTPDTTTSSNSKLFASPDPSFPRRPGGSFSCIADTEAITDDVPVVADRSQSWRTRYSGTRNYSQTKSFDEQCKDDEPTAPRPLPTSTLDELHDELRALHAELTRLMAADHATEQRHLKDFVTFANTHGRDEALNEVSRSLRRRAAEEKFTMGRAERLMLEREADSVYRMTSEEPASVTEAKVDVLQAEREGTRRAVVEAVEILLGRALGLVEGVVVVAGGARGVSGRAPSVGPVVLASRTRA